MSDQKLNCDDLFKSFKMSSNTYISFIENTIKQTDAEKEPNVIKFLQMELDAAKELNYQLTGSKSQEFKKLLCS